MKFSVLFAVVALCLTVFGASARPNADELNGKWTLVADAHGRVITIAVDIKQTGETFTGTTSSELGNGTIDGGKIAGKTFTAILHADIQGSTVDFRMEGSIEGGSVKGTFTNAQFGSIPFTASRPK